MNENKKIKVQKIIKIRLIYKIIIRILIRILNLIKWKWLIILLNVFYLIYNNMKIILFIIK
jgi:hypothetical protein